MEKILVTGASGFVGRYLVPELQVAGYEVVGIDRENGDLAGADNVFEWWLDDEKPGIVVHLAAQVSRLLSEDDPGNTVRCNAVATTYVARACAERGVKLAYTSTSDVYGNHGDGMVNEMTTDLRPQNIYAVSKLWGEEACRLYVKPENLLILRLSMVYGPFQAPGHMSPVGRGRAAIINFLYQGLHRLPMPVHIGAERSNCYVTDTVRAIRMLIEKNRFGVWNIGRDDDARPIIDIAKLACDLTDASYDLIEMVQPPPIQVVIKRLSMQKIRTIGWKPEVSLEEGMRRALEWVRTLPPPG